MLMCVYNNKFGGITMENEYCECEGITGVYTDNEDFGLWILVLLHRM